MTTTHAEILQTIKRHSGKGTEHTFLDSYLGNSHPRYAISAPILRQLAKNWMKEHKSFIQKEFLALIDSLIKGESATEKTFAGMLLDLASREQGAFDPAYFFEWLDHLEGWAEVDSLCTGSYTIRQIPENWKKWKSVIKQLVKDVNINKKRASLVLFCSPLSHSDNEDIAATALDNIDRLKSERSVMITKAISWLLRSMIRHHRGVVEEYLNNNLQTLPKIAIRETMVKLKTGNKTKAK